MRSLCESGKRGQTQWKAYMQACLSNYCINAGNSPCNYAGYDCISTERQRRRKCVPYPRRRDSICGSRPGNHCGPCVVVERGLTGVHAL